jgi:SlyX protein
VSDSIELLAKRIDELESQAAFQDELHESLNATVAKQDAEILELKRQFSLLSERLKEIGDASPGAAPQDETPPHY